MNIVIGKRKIMNHLELYIKCLMLLMSEYKAYMRLDSTSLVDGIINEKDSFKKKTFIDDDNVISKLKDLLNNIIDGVVTPSEDLMVSIEVLLSTKPALLGVIDRYIIKKNPESSIHVLLIEINRHVKRTSARKELAKTISMISTPNTDIDYTIHEHIEKLNEIVSMKKMNTDGMVDEVDFDDVESVRKAATKATDLLTGATVLETGWSLLNQMTQGGFRRGEFVTISALQHNYKSGLTKSLFLQLATLNKPIMTDESKRPLMVFISLEEEVSNIMLFFYSYLKFTTEDISIGKMDKVKIDPDEVTEYVVGKLKDVGYSIRVLRFKPEMLTYSSLFALLDKFERRNFEIHGVLIDYVKKMNRDGCIRTGPNGTDLLELFSRIRNYMSSKSILFVTPHQLSSDAKRLTRAGIPPIEFVKHVANKGYYADSTQLDQEIDLELFINKVIIQGKAYLTIQRGKHRIPTVIPEEDKFFMLEFLDKHAPIPAENELHNPCSKEETTVDEFSF